VRGGLVHDDDRRGHEQQPRDGNRAFSPSARGTEVSSSRSITGAAVRGDDTEVRGNDTEKYGNTVWLPLPRRVLPLTMCYSGCMSVNVSVRLDDTLAERLRLRARAAGESLSDRLRRYAEEGSRRDEHPLITFRDGPAGRRAAVVGGPDVWEIVMWLEDLTTEHDPVRVLTAEQDISRPLIDAALRYRDAYPDEVEARIALHRHDTAAADAR
jgi:hypothetical protein